MKITKTQLAQYIKDNPALTPAQLEAGAHAAIGGGTAAAGNTAASFDFPTFFSDLTDAQVKQLHTEAEKDGIAKFYRTKKDDIFFLVQSYINDGIDPTSRVAGLTED